MTRPIIILGAGDHGRVVADICAVLGRPVAGFLDRPNAAGASISDHAVLGGDALLDDPAFVAAHVFVPGIADVKIRRRVALAVLGSGGALATLVHPSAVVSPEARIGAGSVLVGGNVVNTGAAVGDFVIVNTGATIDHDCRIGDGTHVAPGATLTGGVVCGEDAFVGAGATIVPYVTIGDGAVVGAGAVVLEDVPPGATVVGNPARRTK